MKALICELCGGNELIKQDDGFFHCAHCGTKYTLEAARKLMVDGVVQVKAADFVVKVGILEKYEGEARDIVIPDNVVEISPSVFEGLPIESVVLGNGVKKIGYAAFANCGDLKSVNFGTNLKEIGERAFMNCSSLGEIELSDGLESIGKFAFAKCENVKRVRVPTGFQQELPWVMVFYGCNPDISNIEGLSEDGRRQFLRMQGKCQHCGGEFEASGSIIKKYICTQCGKKKDY